MYSKLQNGLPDLIRALNSNHYKAGIDQYLSAKLLFDSWSAQPDITREQICASLAALFCTSADEQKDFKQIFGPWYEQLQGQETEKESQAENSYNPPPGLDQAVKIDKRNKILISLGMLLLLLTVVIVNIEPPPNTYSEVDEPAPPTPDYTLRMIIKVTLPFNGGEFMGCC